MKNIFSKISLLNIIGLLSILLFTDYTFAQNPGNSLDFDGSNDYISVPDATALDITNQITIEAWFKPSSSSWAYKKLITIDFTKVSATLTDFPVLVSVTDADLKDSDNGGSIQPDGDDILFIQTDGTKLSHEIEKYDGSTGQLVAWVKIPSLSSSTDTEFGLYYGNSSCSSQQDATNVWDANYKGVWHLGESSGLRFDSTINDNDLSESGTVSYSSNGKFVGAADFEVTDEGSLVIADNVSLSITGNLTISGWTKLESLPSVVGDQMGIASKWESGNLSYDLYIDDGPENGADNVGRFKLTDNNSSHRDADGDTELSAATWYYLTAVYNSTDQRVYLNGSFDASGDNPSSHSTGIYDGASQFSIGRQSSNANEMDGLIDEVRISNTARDSSWIGTEYRNQNSPGTFMSFSNQTAAGVSKSGAYGISTNNSNAYGTINNQSVSGSITAGEWNHISLTYDKDAGGTDEIKLYLNGTQSATGDYATAISTNNNNLLLGDMAGFLGKMDEIRIWNDVRTQQEIRDNMHRIVTPGSESNLVAYWKLNQSSGTSAPDSKGSNTGTLFNMTDGDWVASTAPFGGGIVNSTASFTSGTATLGTFSLTTTNSFDNPVDITSTEILNAPNVLPSVTNPLNDRYWVADVFGTPGTYTANLTFTLPSGYLDLGDEANLNLYNRSSNNDGSWTTLITGASSMTSTTVTFDGVSTLGQFTIGSSGSPLPV
ncbi:MAG: DUF2341 domain-containing protein, partial [Bacteroidetes bacterium]|nr:DUF2341 domain-containing protein [Bacteroidota bacterium]